MLLLNWLYQCNRYPSRYHLHRIAFLNTWKLWNSICNKLICIIDLNTYAIHSIQAKKWGTLHRIAAILHKHFIQILTLTHWFFWNTNTTESYSFRLLTSIISSCNTMWIGKLGIQCTFILNAIINFFPLHRSTFVVFIYLLNPKDDFKLVGYRSHTLLFNSALVWARCRQKSIAHVSPWNGWVLWMKIVDKKYYVGIRASTANRYGRQLADDWLKLNWMNERVGGRFIVLLKMSEWIFFVGMNLRDASFIHLAFGSVL